LLAAVRTAGRAHRERHDCRDQSRAKAPAAQRSRKPGVRQGWEVRIPVSGASISPPASPIRGGRAVDVPGSSPCSATSGRLGPGH
jgi:hypothetical protein